jgi:hypothetical protein
MEVGIRKRIKATSKKRDGRFAFEGPGDVGTGEDDCSAKKVE